MISTGATGTGSSLASLLLKPAIVGRKRRYPWTLDGAPRKPTVGGGRYQHPLLPIYKTRAPRRYS